MHSGESLPAGRSIELKGIAFDGGTGIRIVDVSIDAGQTWQAAALGEDLGRFSFQEWRLPVSFASTGEAVLMVRATSMQGESQPMEAVWNPAGYRRCRRIQTKNRGELSARKTSIPAPAWRAGVAVIALFLRRKSGFEPETAPGRAKTGVETRPLHMQSHEIVLLAEQGSWRTNTAGLHLLRVMHLPFHRLCRLLATLQNFVNNGHV
jgi:hypothetical protein